MHGRVVIMHILARIYTHTRRCKANARCIGNGVKRNIMRKKKKILVLFYAKWNGENQKKKRNEKIIIVKRILVS